MRGVIAVVEVSHETKQLEKMGNDLKDFDFVQIVTDAIGDAALPTLLWPLVSQLATAATSGVTGGGFEGASGTYHNVYQLTYDACESLNGFSAALGGVLTAIAADYKTREEQYGTDFSHIDDE